MLFCLLGALVGGLVAWIWPSPYQAEAELYVGVEVYRARQDRAVEETAGVAFNFAEDYKNWQMANLDSLVTMDPIIAETLSRLRTLDPYWESVDQAEFSETLHPYWRNAGKWRLAAQHPDPRRAIEAASIWQDVVIERIHEATAQAQNTMLLDFHLESMTNAHATAQVQVATLSGIREHLRAWQNELRSYAPDQTIAEDAHWLTWYAFAQVGLSPGWETLLGEYPKVGAPAMDYLTWLNRAIPAIEEEIQTAQTQASAMNDQAEQVSQEYAQASRQSLGISANLQVEEITDRPPEIRRLRPSGLLMLIGSCFGLAIWLVWELARLARRHQP